MHTSSSSSSHIPKTTHNQTQQQPRLNRDDKVEIGRIQLQRTDQIQDATFYQRQEVLGDRSQSSETSSRPSTPTGKPPIHNGKRTPSPFKNSQEATPFRQQFKSPVAVEVPDSLDALNIDSGCVVTHDGYYQMGDYIGVGGMGSIRHLTSDLIVKIGDKSIDTETEMIRLVQESKYTIHLLGQGDRFFISEKAVGSLAALRDIPTILQQHQDTTTDEAKLAFVVHVTLNMARAIRDVHNADLAHNDIKADNFLLFNTDNGPLIKLADFGLTCYKNDRPSGATYRFSPPEECMFVHGSEGRDYTHRDLYSLGMMLIGALCNTSKPFYLEYPRVVSGVTPIKPSDYKQYMDRFLEAQKVPNNMKRFLKDHVYSRNSPFVKPDEEVTHFEKAKDQIRDVLNQKFPYLSEVVTLIFSLTNQDFSQRPSALELIEQLEQIGKNINSDDRLSREEKTTILDEKAHLLDTLTDQVEEAHARSLTNIPKILESKAKMKQEHEKRQRDLLALRLFKQEQDRLLAKRNQIAIRVEEQRQTSPLEARNSLPDTDLDPTEVAKSSTGTPQSNEGREHKRGRQDQGQSSTAETHQTIEQNKRQRILPHDDTHEHVRHAGGRVIEKRPQNQPIGLPRTDQNIHRDGIADRDESGLKY